MGNPPELRRRSSAHIIHVLTLQRCAAAFLVLLTYGALLWMFYTVWLHKSGVDDEVRLSTMPVDYETWKALERHRSSERAHPETVSVQYERVVDAGDDYDANSAQFYRKFEVVDTLEDLDGNYNDQVDIAWHRTNNLQHNATDTDSNIDFTSNDISEDFESTGYRADPKENEIRTAYDLSEEDVFSDGDDNDLEYEEPTSAPNRRLLVVTNVPHSGGELVSVLMRRLARENGFNYVQLPVADLRGPPDPAQQRLLEERISSYSGAEDSSVCVSHSSYAVDFAQRESAPPLQFSLIRDPIDRVISRFVRQRFRRRAFPSTFDPAHSAMTLEECLRAGGGDCSFLNGHQYPDLTVPYFCGHHSECTRHNSRWALERAKRTVERSFVTVGVLEDLNTTLAVAETLLPRYFAGAWDTFFIDLVDEIGDSMVPRSSEQISEDVRKRLRANLTSEYEFYDFVKQKVEQQYSAFVLGS